MFLLLFLVGSAFAAGRTEGTKELLLVQAVWRHGDRSPTETYNNDAYQENSWEFGGTGWGQLSPKGMSQHVQLGKKIRSRYITDTYNFISPVYNSKEVYYRSTDVNRTIISAMSNMIGMWSQPDYNNQVGTDYPNSTYWPTGYVPIAVHTVDDDTDYIGNADATCPRQKKLWNMAKTSDELQAFQKSPNVSNLITYLNRNDTCNQYVDIDNLWVIADAFLIENIYKPDMRQKNAWFTDDLNTQVVLVNDQVELYQNGVFNGTLMMNGLDIGLEIMKIRGGSLTNDLEMHMNIKMDCYRKNKTDGACKWISHLKYYVYSAHDTTVYALFSCLGIQSQAVKPHGYPKYSAAAFLELWYDHAEQAPYFRLMYHRDDQSDFEAITTEIDGCDNDFCPLTVWKKYSDKVRPDQPMDQWCLVDPNPPPSKSTSLLSTITGIIFVFFANRLF